MTMASRIRDYITTNGLISKKVAERSGIGHKKFYRLINGETGMSVEEYETICRDGLGVDPSYFFKGKFSKTEKTKSA